MEWHIFCIPDAGWVLIVEKKAPSIGIGDRLAAENAILTGARSSLEKPWARYSSGDHKSDWARESAVAVMVASICEIVASLSLFLYHHGDLSTAVVIWTFGWSRRWARFHSPWEKTWWSRDMTLMSVCCAVELAESWETKSDSMAGLHFRWWFLPGFWWTFSITSRTPTVNAKCMRFAIPPLNTISEQLVGLLAVRALSLFGAIYLRRSRHSESRLTSCRFLLASECRNCGLRRWAISFPSIRATTSLTAVW